VRIGINLLAMKPGWSGGQEFHVRNLLNALQACDADNEYVMFVRDVDRDDFARHAPGFRFVGVKIRPRNRIGRIVAEQTYLPFAATKYRLDVLHSPSYTWPILCSVPGVVTIHDMLYKRHPQYISAAKRAFWGALVPLSAKRCKRVLTDSEASKRDIVELLRIDPSKVVVTPLALDKRIEVNIDRAAVDEACGRYGIRRPYILSVGGLMPHKNSGALLRALSRLRKLGDTKNINLVITGNDEHGERRALETLAAELKLDGALKLPGYVCDKDLPALYAGAAVYASASYLEGFGLTVLEAMNHGIPVVASNCASLPEVVGNAAAIVAPDDYDSLAEALHRAILDDSYRQVMVERGRVRVQQFSWKRTAQLTLQAYREAAARTSYGVVRAGLSDE
jgi:glycosyltransferase involved in cell wall biosynthesis